MISVQSLTPFQIALLVSTSNEWPSQCLRNWVPLGYTTKAISETISAALQHAALDTRWPWPTRQYLWRGWHRDTESSRGLRARRLPSLNHLVVTGFRQGLRYIRWFQWAEHAFPFFIYIGVLFYMFSSYENIFGIVSLKVKPMWLIVCLQENTWTLLPGCSFGTFLFSSMSLYARMQIQVCSTYNLSI